MELPRTGGVIIRMTLMMARYDIYLWMIVSSLEDERYNTLFMRVVLTKDSPAYVSLTWRVRTFSCKYCIITLAQKCS